MDEIKSIIESKHPGKLFLTLKEASELLGIKVQTIYFKRSKKQPIPFTIRSIAGKKMVSIAEILKIAS